MLYFRTPAGKPLIWFIPAGLAFFAIVYFAVIKEEKRFNFELMLFPPILLSAVSMYFGKEWLHFLVLPYMTFLTFYSSPINIIVLSALLPFINMYGFFTDSRDMTLVFFYVAVAVSSITMVWLTRHIRKEKKSAEESLNTIRNGASEFADTAISLKDESIMSNYFSSLLEVEEEFGRVLNTVKRSLFADSALFFEKDSLGQLKLRSTTEEDKSVIMTGGGVIGTVLNGKQGLIIDEIKRKKTDAGYIKKYEFDSLAAVCVLEGDFVVGVLAVDSDRYNAFNSSDLETLNGFSDIISGIVRRGRIYPQIRISHEGLKTLHNESFELLSTLDIGKLCKRIVKAVNGISGEPVALFLKKEKMYELVASYNIIAPEKKSYMMGDTLLDICIKNSQRLYLSDVSSHKKKVLPFKTGDIASVICFPMVYEDSMQGLVVTISGKKNAFNIYQMDLMDVLTNQASVSIANARLHHDIEKMAITDGLTGLYNHRYFQERLAEEFRRIGRNRIPLSLIITDIDFFKNVNDTYGHPAGDVVLKGVSDIIKSRMRETDMAARYGGEEFALILINTNPGGAKQIAEDLRRSVEKTDFPGAGRISISLGISSFPADADSKEELIKKADEALYFAKENGRNRSVLWSGAGK
ncbi:phytochrome-like protein cph2 [bacterium BMS3Abin07]|nr:phytochrome-like protein cph2 [bacterium BMS3Abin07]GBE31299.1 phytochrome-like protein cph2 [bacterium BMS3Bbin05]